MEKRFVWHPDGFYDKAGRFAQSFPYKELVTAAELERRAKIAAKENNTHSIYKHPGQVPYTTNANEFHNAARN